MHTLNVKKLDPRAKLPTVATPGEDLGYDLYALEDVVLDPRVVTKVRTGIAVEAFIHDYLTGDFDPAGLFIRDRSSIASQGIFTHGGVVDAGYRGEIIIVMTLDALTVLGQPFTPAIIKAGAKVAQMIPVPVLTGDVVEVVELSPAARGEKGFGSSGR